MSHPHIVRCIYCKELRHASKEHVLQASLGGNLTIQLVCTACNGAFSKIDQSLAENSFVALSRIGVTRPLSMDVQLGGNHFFERPPGIWNDLKIVNALQPVLLPQIHLVKRKDWGELSFVGSEQKHLDQFVALIDTKVADGSLLAVHVKVGPSDRCSTSRLVGYRSNALYVRAGSEEAGGSMLKLLTERWHEFRASYISAPVQTPFRVERPSVQLALSLCPDDNHRAVAKIAFTMMASHSAMSSCCSPRLRTKVLSIFK